jgi:hypothetical protein
MEDGHFTETKKARQVRSNVKTMLIVFFDVRGIVHQEFVPPGQTVKLGILLGSFETTERECAKKTPRIVKIG